MAFSDRCSEGAKRALALAQDAARSMGHNYVGSEHLLLGLINEGEGAAARALAAFNITADGVLCPKGNRLYTETSNPAKAEASDRASCLRRAAASASSLSMGTWLSPDSMRDMVERVE